MANVTINSLPAALAIDGVNDLLPIYQNSSVSTLSINRNTFLGIASQPVGLTDSQTLTNKILTSPTLNTPTISSPTMSGTLTGTYTIGGTPTFPSSVVTLTGSQTLTNKVLTAPTITNATLSADTITGFTTSTNGTVYGISVTAGQITNAAIANGTIGSAQIATNGIAASNLATNAITLGYTQITGNLTTSSTTAVYATGLTSTVTIPAGGRRIKVTVFVNHLPVATAPKISILSLWTGASAGTLTTQLESYQVTTSQAGNANGANIIFSHTPAAGSLTYNVGFQSDGGGGATTTLSASATAPAFILVEAI